MRVMIVDKRAPSFALLGYIEAVAGMTTVAGNEIVKVNGDSCQVRIAGKLYRKSEVCIDRAVAVAHGWEPPPAARVKPTRRAPQKRTRRGGKARAAPRKKSTRKQRTGRSS